MMEIDVYELKKMFDNKEDFVLIDVREQYEYDEYNLGGKHLPLAEVMDSIDTLGLEKDKEIVIHCKSGKRSLMATILFQNAGYSNARSLSGGIEAWQSAFETTS